MNFDILYMLTPGYEQSKIGSGNMRRIMIGQALLVLCCIFYIIWWYRGYRPGTSVLRASGVNGILLLITAVLGICGLTFSLMPVPETGEPKIDPIVIVAAGIISYFVLLVITRFGFHRIVTTELILIVGWTVLEITVINRLNAAGFLTDRGFTVMCAVIAAAFLISMILYVAYYRMEEMKAFYAAMIPLITEAAAMTILLAIL